jgi:hypothetical protein
MRLNFNFACFSGLFGSCLHNNNREYISEIRKTEPLNRDHPMINTPIKKIKQNYILLIIHTISYLSY